MDPSLARHLRRTAAAVIASCPIAVGTKLVNLVKKGVEDSTPVLLCGSPRVVRELAIDVVTGDVVKK